MYFATYHEYCGGVVVTTAITTQEEDQVPAPLSILTSFAQCNLGAGNYNTYPKEVHMA